jgi:hypothetical protein
VWKGAYSPTGTYAINDVVQEGGSSFIITGFIYTYTTVPDNVQYYGDGAQIVVLQQGVPTPSVSAGQIVVTGPGVLPNTYVTGYRAGLSNPDSNYEVYFVDLNQAVNTNFIDAVYTFTFPSYAGGTPTPALTLMASRGTTGATGPIGTTGGVGATGPVGPAGAPGEGGGGGSARILFDTVATTSLTVTIGMTLMTFYITNSALNSLTLPATTSTAEGGLYWTLRNATTATLSITVGGANGSVLTPLVIPGLSSATLVVSPTTANTVLLF